MYIYKHAIVQIIDYWVSDRSKISITFIDYSYWGHIIFVSVYSQLPRLYPLVTDYSTKSVATFAYLPI